MGAKLQEATELVIFDLFQLVNWRHSGVGNGGLGENASKHVPITMTMHYKRSTMPTSCRVYIAANTTSVPYS
jgi:hypothetical protein